MDCNITEEEWGKVVVELANRMKNVVFMNANNKAKTIVDTIKKDWAETDSEEPITVLYSFNFLANDIVEIIGGLRRCV